MARRFTEVVWMVAGLGAVAWFAVAGLYDRYGRHDRYSGMGILVLLYLAAVPAGALVCAALHHVVARKFFGALAIAGGALTILTALLTIVSGEWRLSEQRLSESTAQAARDESHDRLASLSLAELTAVSDDAMAASVLLEKLERLIGDCASAEPIAAAVQKLASDAQLTVQAVADLVHRACPARRAALSDAMVAGIVQRKEAANDRGVFLGLLEIDGSGALLSRVHGQVKFGGTVVAGAIEDQMSYRSAEAYQRSLTILQLGFRPEREGGPPLSEMLREIGMEKNEAWPDGGTGPELALYRALKAVEKPR